MNFYQIPGAADVIPINDLRGDGLEGDEHDERAAAFAADEYQIGWDPTIGDGLSADELIELGWDPFGAVKKAVKGAAKITGQVTGAVTKPVAGLVRKIPVVGKAASSAVRAAGSLADPLAIANPKKLIATQLESAKNSLSLAKQAVKSPVVKTLVTGAAIVFPPVGVPAAAAIATAAAVAAGVDSVKPGVRQAALAIVDNTAKLAQSGDKGAQIALAEIATQKQALTARRLAPASSGAKRLVFDVLPGGRINRIAV